MERVLGTLMYPYFLASWFLLIATLIIFPCRGLGQEQKSVRSGDVTQQKEASQGADQEIFKLLNQAHDLETKEGKLGEAISTLERALALAEKTHGLDHATVAFALIQMAGIYYPMKGDLSRAEELYIRAIAIGEKLSEQKYAYQCRSQHCRSPLTQIPSRPHASARNSFSKDEARHDQSDEGKRFY